MRKSPLAAKLFELVICKLWTIITSKYIRNAVPSKNRFGVTDDSLGSGVW